MPHGAGPGPPLRRIVVGGLPLVRRTPMAAQRAGFKRVLLAGARPEDQSLLVGAGATPLTVSTEAPIARCRVVLRRLRRAAGRVAPLSGPDALEPESLRVDGSLAAVVDRSETSRILAIAARGGTAAGVFAEVRRGLKVVEGPFDPAGRFVMSGPADAPAAETWLLGSLIKPGETFMSRQFERRLSLALTEGLLAPPSPPTR